MALSAVCGNDSLMENNAEAFLHFLFSSQNLLTVGSLPKVTVLSS